MCKNMDNLNIGGVPLKSHAVLAPMAGVSDRAYRELCVRFGAAYCVSEMVSSKALSFNSKKSEELMEISDLERPCGIQIFGDDPKCMADAAKHALENKPDIIDINMGCPCSEDKLKRQRKCIDEKSSALRRNCQGCDSRYRHTRNRKNPQGLG